MAALLERFYDPQQGSVLLDGHPLSSLDPSWVRREVAGYIHQEPVLFATSVMENIRYGRPSATDQEVRGQTVPSCVMFEIMSSWLVSNNRARTVCIFSVASLLASGKEFSVSNLKSEKLLSTFQCLPEVFSRNRA